MTQPAYDKEGGILPPSSADDNEEFNKRVSRIMSMMETDDTLRDRLLAELYVQVAEFTMIMREMQNQFQNLGPGGILKMLRGKG